jgi:hypothetical protein
MVVAQVSRLNTAGHETIRVEATAAAGVQRVPGHRHHRRAAPRRPSAAASSDFYARKPPPGRPGRRTCFPDPFCDLFLTRVGLRLTGADHVDRSSARAERQGSAVVILGVMGLRPYVWIMVRIGAIVLLNEPGTASLDMLRKEGS